MVEPAFFALIRTPSSAPSEAELTWPTSAAAAWASVRRAVGTRTTRQATTTSRTRRIRMGGLLRRDRWPDLTPFERSENRAFRGPAARAPLSYGADGLAGRRAENRQVAVGRALLQDAEPRHRRLYGRQGRRQRRSRQARPPRPGRRPREG